jgi:hypothetical protein
MLSGTWSLCVELNISTTPPTVKDVAVLVMNGHPAYKPHAGYDPDDAEECARPGGYHGPRAVLTEVTCRSPVEAQKAMLGIIENEPALAWVKDFPSVKQFLAPPWPQLPQDQP